MSTAAVLTRREDCDRPTAASQPPARNRGTLLAAWLALPALVVTATAIARYLNGHAGVDLLHLDQGLWLASRGENPAATIFGEGLLEDHFGPGILAFAALYRIVATPIWLLLGQGIATWAAVWQIARRLEGPLGWKRSALLGSALFLSPPVAYALFWDAHHIVFAVPFALAAVFAIQDDRPWRGCILGLVAALFRADAAFAVLAAFAVFPRGRLRRWPAAAVLLAYAVFATHMERALGDPNSHWAGYYGQLGESPVDALLHPWRIVSWLISFDTLDKAFPWLLTGAFLALARPRLAVPALAIALPTLLAQWPGTFLGVFQYGIAPSLLLAVAWIPVLHRLPQRRFLLPAIALIALIAGWLVSQPFLFAGSVTSRSWQEDTETLCIVQGIPGEAGVSSTVQAGTLLAHRRQLFVWPYPFEGMPKDVNTSPRLRQPEPRLAGDVDYVIAPRQKVDGAPPGFVEDGSTRNLLRFRRLGTTQPGAPSCAQPASPTA